MSEPASISSGIAERYAVAIFGVAEDAKALPKLESNVEDLAAALSESADLRRMISSPVISRGDQEKAIEALGKKMKFIPAMQNGVGLMAQKRRLFVLPALVAHLRTMIAENKGEVAAEVVSAKALTKTQSGALAKMLKERIGKDIKLEATVDESLIGGLIVKVGSQMIDTSIRSRLNSLQNAMKEVG